MSNIYGLDVNWITNIVSRPRPKVRFKHIHKLSTQEDYLWQQLKHSLNIHNIYGLLHQPDQLYDRFLPGMLFKGKSWRFGN